MTRPRRVAGNVVEATVLGVGFMAVWHMMAALWLSDAVPSPAATILAAWSQRAVLTADLLATAGPR